MRLTKGPLLPQENFLVDLETDFLPDDQAAQVFAQRQASGAVASTSESSRSHLTHPVDICNIEGILELPTSFGPLHLGEVTHFLPPTLCHPSPLQCSLV